MYITMPAFLFFALKLCDSAFNHNTLSLLLLTSQRSSLIWIPHSIASHWHIVAGRRVADFFFNSWSLTLCSNFVASLRVIVEYFISFLDLKIFSDPEDSIRSFVAVRNVDDTSISSLNLLSDPVASHRISIVLYDTWLASSVS